MKQNTERITFHLIENGRKTGTTYHNRQPRGAALKAANKGVKDIVLEEVREGKPNRFHHFKGQRIKLKAADKTDFQKERGINYKANVKKTGVSAKTGATPIVSAKKKKVAKRGSAKKKSSGKKKKATPKKKKAARK